MSTDWKDFLLDKGARFNGEQLTGFDSQPESRRSNLVSVMSSRRIIQISGPDSAKFLQGQISVHMDTLDETHHRLGVACTPKGRMYTSFRILNTDSGYLLSLCEDIAETTLATLGKYAVFFKSELSLDDSMISLALSGEIIEAALAKAGIEIPESGSASTVKGGYLLQKDCGFELWIDKEQLPHWWDILVPACTPASEHYQQLLDMEAVIPHVTAELVEKYLPQQLNMPSIGGVSFRKGCYTGQEIVTRMQSLGQQKNRTYRLLSDSELDLNCGDKLFDQNGKSIGEVLQSFFAEDSKKTEMLAVIRIEAAQQGVVYADDALSAELNVQPLPYNIDAKQELQQ